MSINHVPFIRTTVSLALLLPHRAVAAPSPATITYAPGTHSINPDTLNQPGFFVLFALIGAGMVIASVWFFFWAKNGGFVWREGDWDDYKSTVLRRKGPDGRTLTNATKSTKLGGRSVKGGNSIWGKSKWGQTEKGGGRAWDEEDALTEATGWEGEYRDEKAQKEHKSRKSGRGKGRGRMDEELLAYRAEQPARVGGLNSAPEGNGSHYAYSSTGHTNHNHNPATKIPTQQQQQPKRKSFLTKQREAKAFKRAEKRAKEDIARARKDREEYIYNSKASKATKTRTTQTHNGPPAPPPHRTRRNSAETVATSTVFSASEVSSINDKKKDVASSSSYYDAYRPAPPDRRIREQSRTPGDREYRQRSSSRTRERPSGGRQREDSRSRSHSRTRTSDHGGSRQSSPRKTRSRFPPSSYNGSDISGVSGDGGERHAATTTMPRFAHPQVPDLRATAGGYGSPTTTGRRAGGYANRFRDSLSDSSDEDDGDLGGMRGGYGGGGRKW